MRRPWWLIAACASACGRVESEPAEVPDAQAVDAIVDASPPPDSSAVHDTRDATDTTPSCDDASAPAVGTAWMLDECLWQAVPELSICEVYEASLPSERYPTHPSTECGVGCRWLAPAAVFAISQGWSDGATTYVRLQYGDGRSPAGTVVREMYDLTHDRVLASFEQRVNSMRDPDGMEWAQCLGDYHVTLGGEAFETWWFDRNEAKGGGPLDLYYARSRYRESPRLEPLGVRHLSKGSFDVGAPVLADGYVAYLDQYATAHLHVSKGITPPLVFDPVEPPGSYANAPASWGDTVAWSAAGNPIASPSLVSAWSPSRGFRVVATRDRKVFSSTLGADGFTWVESDWTGSHWDYAKITNATLVRMREGSPSIEIATGLGDRGDYVVTGGGYAAVAVYSKADPMPERMDVVVARFSDGKVWKLGTGPGTMHWTWPSFIDDHVLVLGAADSGSIRDNRAARRLYVLDVAELDALAKTFASP